MTASLADTQGTSAEASELGVANAGFPRDLYTRIPCTVGYSYIRFEVDGTIRPCCISKHPIGDIRELDWREVWHSGAWMAFRSKLLRIHREHFHLADPEWRFCNQCSHLDVNLRNHGLLEG